MSRPIQLVLALLALAAVPVAACADARSEGQQTFVTQCKLCHDDSPAKGRFQGPPLFGVFGRKIGSAPDFAYSDALKQAGAKGQVWDETSLDTFLSDPQKMMPGTAMPIMVENANDRKNLIAYLKGLDGGGNARPVAVAPAAAKETPAITHEDWRKDAPGVHHKVTVASLPAPMATPSASNSPDVTDPDHAAPVVPKGFSVSVFAADMKRPRQVRTAPSGDLYVTEAGAGRITIFRNTKGVLNTTGEVFATGLKDPFGVAFYPVQAPKYVYVSSPTSVVRYPIGGGEPETIVADLSTGGGHSSRDILFSPDGKYLYVAVGSSSNVAEGMGAAPDGGIAAWEASHGKGASWGGEDGRALVLRFDPDGKNRHVVATGIRNCVGLGIGTKGELYCSVNERDGLGDDLVPDYFSHIQDGGFYGWPWYYLGGHEDPRHKGERADLKAAAILPDLLIASHSAPLGFSFYAASAGAAHAFPKAYVGDAFVALHGSWNRATRTGSKVVRVLMKNGRPTGEYEDFMTGLVIDDKHVAGRPVGVAVGPDGALYVSDDAGGKVWRIAPN